METAPSTPYGTIEFHTSNEYNSFDDTGSAPNRLEADFGFLGTDIVQGVTLTLDDSGSFNLVSIWDKKQTLKLVPTGDGHYDGYLTGSLSKPHGGGSFEATNVAIPCFVE